VTASTIDHESLFCPPLMRPRARTWPLPGRLNPVNSQPPLIRAPAPSGIHDTPPSTDTSKLTALASGDAPPRNHSTRFALVTFRLLVALSFKMRATRLRV